MAKVIMINTKTRTVRVENADKNIDWITIKGTHVPIEKGQSKSSAVKSFVESKRGGKSDTEKQQPAKKDLGAEQLERLEKKGKGWGKEQMSVLRKLGKVNPQGLKDELDRMETDEYKFGKPAKKESVESISDEYMREINSLRKKAEKARKMGQGKTAMLLETRADSLAKEMFEKEDSEKNARWAEHEAEMDRASKEREKAAKDQEEADFQKWKLKRQQPAKRDIENIPISQLTPAERKILWDREQERYEATQKDIAKDTIKGLSGMVAKTEKLIESAKKTGTQEDVDDLTKYRDELKQSIKELSEIHGFSKKDATPTKSIQKDQWWNIPVGGCAVREDGKGGHLVYQRQGTSVTVNRIRKDGSQETLSGKDISEMPTEGFLSKVPDFVKQHYEGNSFLGKPVTWHEPK